MSISPGYVAFKLAQELSPIILTRGIATAVGGYLPIIALTEGLNFAAGLLTGGDALNLDNFFAHYTPLPGGSLIKNQVATYPFANQSIAANAIISQGLNISLMMNCPARGTLGYAVKLATMTALKATLDQHNNSGGTYSVVTPSFIYTDCILTDFRDVSGGESKQYQYQWQLDFFQPLVSLQAAQTALNNLMQRLTNGTPPGTPSGAAAIGLPVGSPLSLAA
jgi:hypothetical protein